MNPFWVNFWISFSPKLQKIIGMVFQSFEGAENWNIGFKWFNQMGSSTQILTIWTTLQRHQTAPCSFHHPHPNYCQPLPPIYALFRETALILNYYGPHPLAPYSPSPSLTLMNFNKICDIITLHPVFVY